MSLGNASCSGDDATEYIKVRHAHPQLTKLNKMTRKTSKKQADFETSLAELEILVETLEQGDISLEESLKLFFTFKKKPTALTESILLAKATQYKQKFDLDLTEWVRQLFVTNPVNDGRLII